MNNPCSIRLKKSLDLTFYSSNIYLSDNISQDERRKKFYHCTIYTKCILSSFSVIYLFSCSLRGCESVMVISLIIIKNENLFTLNSNSCQVPLHLREIYGYLIFVSHSHIYIYIYICIYLLCYGRYLQTNLNSIFLDSLRPFKDDTFLGRVTLLVFF